MNRVAPRSLPGSDGAMHAVADGRGLTVVEFFSAHCPCQQMHDARLRKIAADYAPWGVAFLAVSSEADLDPTAEAVEAKRRTYTFPIVHDEGSRLAHDLGAEYATFAVLLDGSGRVLYRGGIDSDKLDLHDDATPFLRDAIDDALAGRPARRPSTKTLGCSLSLR